MIEQLEAQALNIPPKLVVGDGALGFLKTVQPKAKEALHDILMVETRQSTDKAFARFLRCFEAKYPIAV